MVSADPLNKAVKCVWVNTNFASILVDVALMPELEERKLSSLLDFGVASQDP
jgi:hypothetical protein